MRAGGRRAGLLRDDLAALDEPPSAAGVRLIPPGDPDLQGPNRALLAPDEAMRRRLFRPVASPGAVLSDGILAGLWRARARGRRLDVAVEALGRIPRGALDEEAERLAVLRGSAGVEVAAA